MEGRDFAAPAHLLSERGALVHRAASRIAPSGHSSVQHAGHFPPGKYYPSHIPMAPHSGSGLMGNSSASFMGTFLASSLGSPPSHPSHPSRPPSSPSSPSFRGGPHSSASQIWFPHSHEAGPGYPRFSGSLAHTFLPMSHLDHHANSGVLYGQHRFYDTQKENFYLRGLPSQPPLISANHSLPPMSRAGSGHTQGSCSRDRDPGVGTGMHKGLKEGTVERVVVNVKDKERSSGKQEAKERQQQQQHHSHQPPQPTHHHHSHTHQQHPHYPQHPLPLEEVNSRALERHKASLTMYSKEHPQSMSKPLSACLHNGKMQNGDTVTGAGAKVSMSSCGGEDTTLRAMGGAGSSQNRHLATSGSSRCTKEGVSGEMRISEQPSDCLERGQAPLHHTLPYSVPPPLHMGSATGGAHSHPHAHPHTHPHPGGFHCLQLHPSHAHHSHHTHHHPDFFCPPPPAPLANPASHERGPVNVGREPKVIGPTFVPSVADMGDKSNGPFQLNNPDCQGVGSGGGGSNAKDKTIEKNGGSGHHNNWHRKQPQQQQQHPYRKTEKAPDWMQSHHQHLQPSQLPPQQQQQPPHSQQQHQVVRSRSAECINSGVEMDVFRSSLPQGPKAGHSVPHSVNTSPYRDCSHPGPPPNSSPLGSKNMGQHSGTGAAHGPGGSCSLQRDGQKVARIRHQQHGRPGPDAPSELNQGNSQELKRKLDMSPYGYSNSNGQHHHQQPPVPPWNMRPPHHMSQPEEDQRKSYMELGSTGGQHSQQQQQQQPGISLPPPQPPTAPPLSQQQQQPQQQPDPQGPTQGESSAMKSLLKYSNQQQPLLVSQKNPFGGLGNLKSGPSGGSCALQGNKQTLPSRKGTANDSERPDYNGRSRDMGDTGHGESEVRQPPVGIAVAVARQREPPCRSAENHPNSRQGRVHPSVKGQPRSMYLSDPSTEEERKRLSEEQIGLTCLDRERDAYIRDNKERVEFARIHPSSSCHGDLTSHLMVPGGTSLQSGQLGDPAAHSTHHHWMPRTGSPSLWMTGHSYAGIGHTTLHQNLPPGFSAAMPGPLQPVLPLPQDPSAQLVVLPSEPPTHPATHHLDVMEQPGLWPPVYGARGPPSHMQHPAVYSRSQFLRQQELYALQQHQQLQHQHQSHQSQPSQLQSQPQQQQQQQQQQQHRAAHSMNMQHQTVHNTQIQKRADEPSVELEELISEPRTSKPAKAYSYNPPQRNTSPPGTCTAHLSPCCQSPSLRQHPKSTPSTPCPAPSPVAAVPHSPAISPAPPQMLKGTESQDKTGEGQPPHDYPESLEPDLPPGYTYPTIAMDYRSGPSPQDVQLAEPADLEAVQVEPAEHAPQSLATLGEDLDCQVVVRPLPEPLPLKEMEHEEEKREVDGVLEQRDEVEITAVTEANYVHTEEEQAGEQGQTTEEVLVCPPVESTVCEAPSCPVSISTEEPDRQDTVITLEEEEDDEVTGGEIHVEYAQKVSMPGEQEPELPAIIELDPTSPESQSPPNEGAEDREQQHESKMTPNNASVDSVCLSPASASAPSPSEASFSVPHKPLVPCYWSLELLIAAAFCTDVPPFPLFSFSMPSVAPSQCNPYQGIELLSELADLELQQQKRTCGKSQEEELLMFDLQSLATLATARALELGSEESSSVSSERQFPARRILNLRRKCTWTPRNEPVCPAKVSMETMDGPELAMRVKLAELQRRYKEKQKELAKLQRKHDHQKEETPRSPARRGPGRPRKRKPTLTTGPVSSSEGQRKVKSMGGCLPEDLGGGGDNQRRKKRLSSRGFERLSSTQVKAQGCRKSSLHSVLNSKLSGDVAQLKQKAQVKKTLSGTGSRDKEISLCNSNLKHGHRSQGTSKADSRRDSGGQSDTAASGDSVHQESWTGLVRCGRKRGLTTLSQPRTKVHRGQRHEAMEEEESSPAESDSSDQEDEEEEGSCDTDEIQDYRAQPFRDITLSSSMIGPSPSSVVKLEANQKARNKKQRQELYGSHSLSGAEGEVKVRKKPNCRLGMVTAVKNHQDHQDRQTEVARKTCGPRSKEPRWGSLGTRGNRYRRSMGLATFPTTSERLKRATRKSTMLRGAINKRRSCWPIGASSLQSEEGSRGQRSKDQQPKGRAVSRLLESFAADEGFQMDGSSFSEEEEHSSHSHKNLEVPNCVLTKELLTDGLKVLISKEDELLYAARVHTLELPDIFSVVVDGERGNRPRIYSLEQLLQEAVLDIRPESEAVLNEGTRVCAYWSERSRCLYPGYVRRGGSSDEGKQGGVMVEFDDGDRGKISLPNIRLLPPGYQIHCGESSPALLVPSGSTAKRTSSLEQAPISERPSDRLSTINTVTTTQSLTVIKRRPGRPKGSGKKQKQQQIENANKSPSPFLGWSSLANTRKRTSDNLFQFNGAPKRTLKGKEDDLFSLTHTQPQASIPTKGLFSSSSFEVDSFRSIANGYSSFCTQSTGPGSGLSLGSRSGLYGEKRKQDELVMPRGKKSGQEFLIKLDHEGVTSPKTKNSKALLLRGGSSSVSGLPRTEAYSHPVLLVKDNKKGASRVELLLKGTTPQRKPSPSLRLGEYGDLGFSSHRECHSSYSDLDDEEEEEEEERRRAALAAASGGLRTAGRFLSRLSVSSSSSGSSSSSSSGSLSSSSLCSSENDSSYSSEDEDSSTLMLQSCLSSHRGLLQPSEPSTSSRPRQHAFVAKAMAVSNAKGAPSNQVSNSKSLKRKECAGSISKPTKDFVKKPRMLPDETTFIPRPKMSAFLAGRQMWRWSGNPTQRRGLKGKARKLFYKAIVRGRETVKVGDCAVFLSAGRPNLPYVGQIENFWESWTSRMVVKVKWFYHPEETKLGKRHRDGKHALYQSCHEDENDVQTISHKCQVVSREEYECLTHNQKPNSTSPDLYYLAGTYDPTTGQLVTAEGVSIIC
ncbi:BAH and coiled-coil domain-containing protein 1 isoform X2 [Archocentrus centrarchus]|uniref:BAH and coiled-coil domain-containing protein 1 isoform X2 n=1 Tax=Archocentrus centrarchus TaxID=63155 RepID=UPI0011E9DDA2|nr:BAH and coiled-coil domain-containing protein 1-like isoform X2 [Archocentrus centrarchus]